MSRQVNKKLQRWILQLLLIGIPGILWWGGVQFRSAVFHPYCLESPEKCTPETLLPIDRLSVGMEDDHADGYSFQVQNFSGALAVGAPLLWQTLRFVTTRSPTVLTEALTDLSLVLQATTWNGFFTELARWIVQRPRPFVYTHPLERGKDPAHYTSFYSGHTSFTAASSFILFLIFWRRKAPAWMQVLAFLSTEALVISVAYFRILAGRHFLTDVLAGAMAGSLVAYFAFLIQNRLPKSK